MSMLDISDFNPLSLKLLNEKLSSCQSLEKLIARSTFFFDPPTQNTENVLITFKQYLIRHSNTLKHIDLSYSNAKGLLFYYDHIVQIPESKGETSVEGFFPSENNTFEAIVRDDNPPIFLDINNQRYYYIKTTFKPLIPLTFIPATLSSLSGIFQRHYVLMNWLCSLYVLSLASTPISSYGFCAVVASSCFSLSMLDVSRCPAIDDRGILSLKLCTQLQHLNISYCPNISKYGVMSLSNLSFELLSSSLLSVNITGCLTPDIIEDITTALLHSLVENGYNGKVINNKQWPDYKRGAISQRYKENQNKGCSVNCKEGNIFDLKSEQHPLPMPPLNPSQPNEKYPPGFEKIPSKICIDLSNQFFDDNLLKYIGEIFGKITVELILDGTFVSDKGLQYLIYFPNLFRLSLNRCYNITDKTIANKNINPAIMNMEYLRDFRVSDTRISGKSLFGHRCLQLVELDASRAPFSIYAINLLVKNCGHTLQKLHLSGCGFMNRSCIFLLVQFQKLVLLDISYCTSLTPQDINEFCTLMTPEKLIYFQTLNVSGLNLEEGFVNQCQNLLSSSAHHEVEIIFKHASSIIDASTSASVPLIKPFRGEHPTDNAAYQRIDSINHKMNPMNMSNPSSSNSITSNYFPIDPLVIMKVQSQIQTKQTQIQPQFNPNTPNISHDQSTNSISSLPNPNVLNQNSNNLPYQPSQPNINNNYPNLSNASTPPSMTPLSYSQPNSYQPSQPNFNNSNTNLTNISTPLSNPLFYSQPSNQFINNIQPIYPVASLNTSPSNQHNPSPLSYEYSPQEISRPNDSLSSSSSYSSPSHLNVYSRMSAPFSSIANPPHWSNNTLGRSHSEPDFNSYDENGPQ